MSYRRTWLLVDGRNRCWRERLGETVAGGGEGRGAKLSEMGRIELAAYRALEGWLEQSGRGGDDGGA